jgi:hypothetical protein
MLKNVRFGTMLQQLRVAPGTLVVAADVWLPRPEAAKG